jgi:hypothetical protein
MGSMWRRDGSESQSKGENPWPDQSTASLEYNRRGQPKHQPWPVPKQPIHHPDPFIPPVPTIRLPDISVQVLAGMNLLRDRLESGLAREERQAPQVTVAPAETGSPTIPDLLSTVVSPRQRLFRGQQVPGLDERRQPHQHSPGVEAVAGETGIVPPAADRGVVLADIAHPPPLIHEQFQ